MRKSWIKKLLTYAGRKLQLTYLATLLVTLLAEKNNEPSRLEKQVETKPKFLLKTTDLLLILGVSIILLFSVYITYKTGELESTRYYQLK